MIHCQQLLIQTISFDMIAIQSVQRIKMVSPSCRKQLNWFEYYKVMYVNLILINSVLISRGKTIEIFYTLLKDKDSFLQNYLATSQHWMGQINLVKLFVVHSINTATSDFFLKTNSRAMIRTQSSWVLVQTVELCCPAPLL